VERMDRRDNSQKLEHPLLALHNRTIDSFRLYLKEVLQLEKSELLFRLLY
jgi:hypothetical protein